MLRIRAERSTHEGFWSICSYLSRSSEFTALGERVHYDLRRLFAGVLLAELQSDGQLSRTEMEHAAAIADLFDPIFYLTEYQDVATAGINPLLSIT